MSERLPDNSTAVIFQGQGHQFAGMGKDTYKAYPEARRIYEEASEAIDSNVATLCFEDPDKLLGKSAWAQPAIVAMELADYAVYQKRSEIPGHFAGHSLGEYSAVAASGTMTNGDAIRIVHIRGQMMDEVSAERPGAMAVVFGVARERLNELREKYGVEVANDNSRDQKVIAGLRVGVESARQQIKDWGGKIRILDNIQVASHCSQMDSIRDRLRSVLEGIEIEWPPKVPFVSNTTGEYTLTIESVRENLARQVSQTVEWVKSVGHMRDHGAEAFIEFGPKKVLSTMIERDDPDLDAKHFSELEFTD